MGNPQYGMASALSDVYKGYEAEEGRVAAQAKGDQDTEKRGLELNKMRAEAGTEKSKAAIGKVLQGDMEGAMELLGVDGMEDLTLNRETNLLSWTVNGEEHSKLLPHLMVAAGMNPKDLDTPEAKLGRDKELVTHKAQEAKKYGIGTGAAKVPADIQRHKYWMKTLTGGDPQKAFKLMQLSKSDPQAAYARILLGLQKQNAEKFGDEKMSDADLQKAAKSSVTSFREGMFDELFSKGTGAGGGQNNQSDPLGLL